ncbi:hypothetical protein E2562_022801 [Oryza meyeriana var. granulata]|uniref:Uncharacterized protein n=1 Tax=Oryza meyeriana var. granulata TaxID=110450 RepID=A0A6G1EY90_9ORYZ|nr:hypothetical protein E2562_022801 [Oryza meyeriana var. granulata]
MPMGTPVGRGQWISRRGAGAPRGRPRRGLAVCLQAAVAPSYGPACAEPAPTCTVRAAAALASCYKPAMEGAREEARSLEG